jgi:hypothetical protein
MEIAGLVRLKALLFRLPFMGQKNRGLFALGIMNHGRTSGGPSGDATIIQWDLNERVIKV